MDHVSTPTTTAVRYDSPLYHEVLAFLYGEAELLDDRMLRPWLDMLTDDVVYRMPVRTTRAHDVADSVLADMDHFHEDRYSLEKRVERFETDHAWAEDPPSRTRRYVTNPRCWHSDRDDEVVVRTNLLLFRSRGDVRDPDLVSSQRTDRLRRHDGELKLADRLVWVDESTLRTQNLAVFL